MPGFFSISPSCPSYFPGVDISVCVRAPVENLLIGLKPEYLMLSLWLFFLLIEAFTKMTFSLSSTYSPRLPNGVFIQGRAWRRFVLTAFPPARGWVPHVGGCGEQKHINPKLKAEVPQKQGQGPTCAKPGDTRTEGRPRNGVTTSPACLHVSAVFSSLSSWHVKIHFFLL